MWFNNTTMSYEKIFGNNVKACREARGLSQKELAEDILGYPEEMIREVEEGKDGDRSVDFYVCLAKEFGVSLEALMTNRYLVPPTAKAAPIVEVAPVVHAHWILKDDKGNGVCSHCKRQDRIDPLATHCRYCGAQIANE